MIFFISDLRPTAEEFTPFQRLICGQHPDEVHTMVDPSVYRKS